MTTSWAVLDTNVLLDLLVFRNPGVAGLSQAVQAGRLPWLGCAEMRGELAHVLRHAPLGGFAVDVEQALTFVDTHMQLALLPAPLPALRLRCSDPQDQMFVDLALHHGAAWLLTRDRALLKLARKAALRGLRICPPERWVDTAAAPVAPDPAATPVTTAATAPADA
ncbi:MAG: PIN domain-containing protein [Proteobacteria bacterium]|nr:PIN domain-containing protein [Pseudomonadota bacterium]